MDTPVAPIPSTSSQLAVSAPVATPSESKNRRRLVWLIGGLAILALGIAIGAIGAKFLNQSQSSSPLTSLPSPAQSPTPTSTPDPTANWKTFVSQRADFSFQHPSAWPVDQCSVSQTYQFGDRVEFLDFAEECITNATSESFGAILVKRIDPFIEPMAYIQTEEDDAFSIASISATQIGTVNGYLVTKQSKPNAPGQLTSTREKYYTFRKFLQFTLVYIILLTNPSYLGWDQSQGIETFHQILSTFKFTNYDNKICDSGREYQHTAVSPVTCRCPDGYQWKIIDTSFGPCPATQARDCPKITQECSLKL